MGLVAEFYLLNDSPINLALTSVKRVFIDIKQYMFTKDKEMHLHVIHTAWRWWKGIHPARPHYTGGWKETPCTSKQLVVKRDTSCSSILHGGSGKGYTLHVQTARNEKWSTLHVLTHLPKIMSKYRKAAKKLVRHWHFHRKSTPQSGIGVLFWHHGLSDNAGHALVRHCQAMSQWW